MKKTTRLLSLILICCLLCGTFCVPAAAAEISFSDITEDQWFYDPIITAAEHGIVAGNADGSYAPRGELTWAQTITFAVRLDQYKKGLPIYGSADQTGANWYDVYMSYALEKGIIASLPANPNAVITRANAAIIFAEVLGDYRVVNDIYVGYFTDVPVGHSAFDAVYTLAEAGVCNGKDDRLFGVNDSFLRGEVAAIVARMAGLVSKAILVTPEARPAFDALEGRVFTYESSTLKGSTTITVGANGAFTGRYMYHNAAETDKEYPRGTVYLCNFTGNFKNVTREDDGHYTMETEPIATSALPDRVVIESGIRYISTVAYGFEETGSFDFFLPGSSTEDMPECLLNALIISEEWGKKIPARTSNAILHNHDAHKAFVEDIPAGVTAANLFDRLEGMTFTYSSGAGGWSTTITFGEDGSFTGSYSDSEMGLTGAAYPGGTVYYNTFWGAFTEVVEENEYRYSLRLRYLYLDEPIGQETTKDGVRFKAAEAAGFSKAGYFTLYLPGVQTTKTPEPMREWISALEGWGNSLPGTIPCWSLYNIGGESPFVTY